jgi:hypothetical protein
MLELLRALIFGQVVTLSPTGVALGEEPIVFKAQSSLEALNAGARLSINVSSVVQGSNSLDAMRRTEESFQPGCIRAFGLQASGGEVQLARQSVAWSPAGPFVVLAQEGGASTKNKFVGVRVSSCRPVPEATAEWANYGK